MSHLLCKTIDPRYGIYVYKLVIRMLLHWNDMVYTMFVTVCIQTGYKNTTALKWHGLYHVCECTINTMGYCHYTKYMLLSTQFLPTLISQ